VLCCTYTTTSQRESLWVGAGQASLPQTTRWPADGTGDVEEDQGQCDGAGVCKAIRDNTLFHTCRFRSPDAGDDCSSGARSAQYQCVGGVTEGKMLANVFISRSGGVLHSQLL
jgi:hypothetical protein